MSGWLFGPVNIHLATTLETTYQHAKHFSNTLGKKHPRTVAAFSTDKNTFSSETVKMQFIYTFNTEKYN